MKANAFCINYFETSKSPLFYRQGSRICLTALRFQLFIAFTEWKKKVPLSIAIGNGELMHECFPKHLRMGTARMKLDKETDEEWKKRGVSMEWSKASTNKKKCSAGSTTTWSKYNNNKHNIVVFYKVGKVQLNSINKKQNGLK